MSPDDVLRLARAVPERWTELDLVHRSGFPALWATLRHGEVAGHWIDDRGRFSERGAPPSSWTVRPLEPYPTNYQWSAMLDPYELTEGVRISGVHRGELFGRPVVRFVAHAVEGYDPICSCCPLIVSEASQRLEYGDDWVPRPGELPDGVELALDLEVGIVVSSRDRGGRLQGGFTTEILRVC